MRKYASMNVAPLAFRAGELLLSIVGRVAFGERLSELCLPRPTMQFVALPCGHDIILYHAPLPVAFTPNHDKVYPQQSVPGNPVQGCWVSSSGSQRRGAAEERWSTGARLCFHHSSHHYSRVVHTDTREK